ncbi:hypothetical protein EVA_03538 [gut metagenome]|uniref:Uncharacterized protein n=1 Tax=gut metagenome TaxID=749906 RepID=J9GLM1_9ZZZZ
MSVYGIVNLVLNLLEELLRHRSPRVIVNTRSINFQHLTVEHLFCSTDVPDTFQQFFPIAATAQFLQTFVIHRKALGNVFL